MYFSRLIMRLISLFVCLPCLCLLQWQLKAQTPNYINDIEPIFIKNCLPCHRSDAYAPFSLEDYEQIVKRAQFIKHVIKTNTMPPWKANSHYRDFANNRALKESEIDKIVQWIDSGCARGNTTAKKAAIKFEPGSQLSKRADLKLKMKQPFRIPGNNKNVYICYKIPFEIKGDTFANAIEFVPGNKLLVHHASYQVLEVAPDVDIYKGPDFFYYNEDTLNRVNDEHDYAYLNLLGKNGEMPIETFHGGWLPGSSAQVYGKGIGFKMPKKGVLLIRNFHYSPTPIEAYDQSGFNIYYSKAKIRCFIDKH